jgi:hypothetical protein
MFAFIVASAATLGAHGVMSVKTANQAAGVLEPVRLSLRRPSASLRS